VGLNLLSNECEWVLFLDDDIVIEQNSIETLFEKYVNNDEYSEYAGFGLAIRNRKYRELNIFVKAFLFVTKLFSFIPGTLTKGGHPQPYLDHQESRRVEWLNGISLWHRNEVSKYNQISNTAEYSAYEDVMFSYRVGQTKKLFFASDSFVRDQVEENGKPLTYKQLISAAYARYKFVKLHPEFSMFWLFVGQLIRNFDFIFRSREDGTMFDRIKLTSSVCAKLFLIIFYDKDPDDLLQLGNYRAI
jgi:GT2 family glycosyltransferase